MKLFLMPKEPSWWIWLATASLLAVGLAGVPAGWYAAIALSGAQSFWILFRHRAWKPYPVQIRIAYTACLICYLAPGFRWMFWVPTLGTFALVLFGYCLMARLLSLMPWNRDEPITGDLLRRTFFHRTGDRPSGPRAAGDPRVAERVRTRGARGPAFRACSRSVMS